MNWVGNKAWIPAAGRPTNAALNFKLGTTDPIDPLFTTYAVYVIFAKLEGSADLITYAILNSPARIASGRRNIVHPANCFFLLSSPAPQILSSSSLMCVLFHTHARSEQATALLFFKDGFKATNERTNDGVLPS